MVATMKPGSVIVDLAAEQGGNCELTRPEEVIQVHGVTIIGHTDLPSRLPTQSSRLYANNVANLLADMTPDKNGKLKINLDDPVVRGSVVTHDGTTIWPPPRISDPSPAKPVGIGQHAAGDLPAANSSVSFWLVPLLAVMIAALVWVLGSFAPPEFVAKFTVFVLACFIGWQVIWNVTPALHTPLMSVTNAISGIIVLGGMLQLSTPWYSVSSLLSWLAVLIAMINVAGGFLVTQRMLAMFRKQ